MIVTWRECNFNSNSKHTLPTKTIRHTWESASLKILIRSLLRETTLLALADATTNKSLCESSTGILRGIGIYLSPVSRNSTGTAQTGMNATQNFINNDLIQFPPLPSSPQTMVNLLASFDQNYEWEDTNINLLAEEFGNMLLKPIAVDPNAVDPNAVDPNAVNPNAVNLNVVN